MLANYDCNVFVTSAEQYKYKYKFSQFHFSPSSCCLILLVIKFLLLSNTLNVHILSIWCKAYVLRDIKEHVELYFSIFQAVHF
jgi:hypothetical protein